GTRGQRADPGVGRADPGPGGGGVVGDVDPAGLRRAAGHAGTGARGRLALGAARPGADRAGRGVPRRRGRGLRPGGAVWGGGVSLAAGPRAPAPDEPAHRPVGRTLLVPAGVALLLATR